MSSGDGSGAPAAGRLSGMFKQSKPGGGGGGGGGSGGGGDDGNKKKQQQQGGGGGDGDEEKKEDNSGADTEEEEEEEEEESEECCICLDDLNLRFKTPCGHTFCFLCIKGVVQASGQGACPLCRAPLDAAFLDKARMKKSDYDRLHEGSDVKFQWRYSGNRGGWWLYDDSSNSALEERYAEFEADSDKDSFNMDIGGRRYVVSFSEMKQKNAADPRRARRINRVPKSLILGRGQSAAGTVKGQAGVAFERSRSKRS